MSRVIFSFAIFVLILALVPAVVDARAMFQEPASSITNDGSAADKNATDFFVPPVALSWLHTGQISATAANNGTYGTYFTHLYNHPLCDGEICPSFMSPEDSDIEYLFGGAIWIGGIVGNDTLVSVAADGWIGNVAELLPPVPSETFAGAGDQSVWMLCTDTITDPGLTGTDPFDNRPQIPLHVRIANRVHAWNSDPENQTIIYDMVVTNIGDQTIEDGYIAFYFDADVYHMSNQANGFTDDITGSIREAGIGYVIDNDGDPTGGVFTETSPMRLFAFKPLITSFTTIDTNFNWWISNGNAVLDYGPQPVDEFGNPECDFGGHVGTPTGDRSKYCMMSHPGWDFDQIYTADSIPGWTYPYSYNQATDFADGYDTRFLMSFGPFTLLPDSSARILYTTFTGDSVIHVLDNLNNLPDNPDQYLANLDFSHVLANAAVADDLAQALIDPRNPVMGLYALHNDFDSTVIEWDPWGFSDVEGYDVYLYQVPPDSMPYPGLAPPWIHPSEADLAASVGQVYQQTFTGLEPYGIYAVSVANRTVVKGIGAMSQPLQIQPGGRPPAPQVPAEYIFIQTGDPAVLQWSPPEGVTVGHYNIYKFANPEEAQRKYYPRYDTGEFSSEVAPHDSFYVDGTWYYYYGMEPYTFVGGDITTFSQYTADSSVYVVTAVTMSGIESEFSPDVMVIEVPPRTKDILVLECRVQNTELVYCDSIYSYYSTILDGYDYDIYDWWDTMQAGGFNPDWSNSLMPYKMVIIDGGWRYDMLDNPPPDFNPTLPAIQVYIRSQGMVAYFGSFYALSNMTQHDPPGYHPPADQAMVDDFGVDSVFSTGPVYYIAYPDIETDSLGGFVMAQSIGKVLPDLHYDPSLNPYQALFWPDSVGPLASAFFNNDNAVPLYTYRSKYPSTSLAEGLPVGIKSTSFAGPVYSFGFRPWYMQQEDMTALVDYLMSQTTGIASGISVIEPDTMNFYWAYAINPMTATIYIGDLSGEYATGDIDQSSIRVNGGVTPTDITVIDVHPDFTGPVLALTVSMRDFLLSYGPLWDRQLHPYTISATMTNGTRFLATGNVFIKGFLRGDANGDDRVNVGDATFLISYLFRDGQPPSCPPAADVNGDCRLDIGDAIYLINYIFRSGPEPQTGCAE